MSEERLEARAFNIVPLGMTQAALKAERREMKAAMETKRRRSQGAVPREKYEAESLSKTKPWLSLNMSRAAWYRSQKKPAVDAK